MITRRRFLLQSGLLCSSAALTGCAPFTPAVPSTATAITANIQGLRPVAALRPGAVVGVIAPASPANGKADAAAAWLKAQGFQARIYPAASRDHNDYLAGDDAARLSDLHAAFADPEVNAIICLRGGYGSTRLLDQVNYALLRDNAKIFVGYSDITALHAAIGQRAGFVTFHGPMMASDFLRNKQEPTVSGLFAMLNGGVASGSWLYHPASLPLQTINGGVAHGRLSGGNLSMIGALLGTPYEPDFRDTILFIEDIGEAPYKIDRLLTQLRLAGKLQQLRGVLIGNFSDTNSTADSAANIAIAQSRIDTLWRQMLKPLNVPVLAGWQSGHSNPNLTLPLGASITLDADRQGIQLQQAIVV